jgi:glycosyltransferase involved in cell wall biosynthesis
MRIVLFGTIAGVGGIERHTRMLAKSLADEGAKVLVVSSTLKLAAGDIHSAENAPLTRAGVQIVWVAEHRNIWRRLLEIPRIVRTVHKFDPETLVGAQTSYHLGFLGMFLPRRVRKIFFEGMSGESNGTKDPRWLVRVFFNEVVGQSPLIAQNFRSSFRWRGPAVAIPAFPEPLEISARLPVAKQRKVSLGTARVAFFSRLVEGKRAFWLVKQWDTLKDLVSVLHIHGAGPERQAIEAYIVANGLGDRVRCCGPYPAGQAYVNLLGSYDITLLPTVFPEGAPLVLLESMACGVPFVANGVGGIPDYATGNPDCLVVSHGESFLQGVRSMLESLARGTIDQSRLQRFYLDHYSHASIKGKWFEHLGIECTPPDKCPHRPSLYSFSQDCISHSS